MGWNKVKKKKTVGVEGRHEKNWLSNSCLYKEAFHYKLKDSSLSEQRKTHPILPTQSNHLFLAKDKGHNILFLLVFTHLLNCFIRIYFLHTWMSEQHWTSDLLFIKLHTNWSGTDTMVTSSKNSHHFLSAPDFPCFLKCPCTITELYEPKRIFKI